MTRAPAATARVAVKSRELLSTTSTSSTASRPPKSSTAAPIPASSLYAGKTTDTRWPCHIAGQDKFFWQSSPRPEGSRKFFLQSSTAVDSPGLLALDLVGERSLAGAAMSPSAE